MLTAMGVRREMKSRRREDFSFVAGAMQVAESGHRCPGVRWYFWR